MAVQSLLRPQSVGSAILVDGGGSTVGDIGVSSSGNKLYMKVQTARFGLSFNVMDTTGDGDTLAQYDYNNEYRGQISFNGFMLANNHLGIENLVTPADDSTDNNPIDVKMILGEGSATRSYKFRMMVQNIIVDWNRVAPIVGIAIQGVMTDSFNSSSATIAFDEAN